MYSPYRSGISFLPALIIVIISIVIFRVILAIILSPKLRGKFMSSQIKAMKNATEESKDDIEKMSTTMANATKDATEIKARAIKRGLTEDEDIYCKHCGAKIDSDSKFCKSCGKEQ